MKTIEVLKELEKMIANALKFNDQSAIYELDSEIVDLVNESFAKKISAKAKELDAKNK